MAKKTQNIGTKKKAPKAPAAAPKTNTSTQKPSNDAKVEEDVLVSTKVDTKNLEDRNNSGLSLDGQVRLLDLTRRHFIEEKDPDLAYPQAVRIGMNRVIGVGIIATLAEYGERGESKFAALVSKEAYPALAAAAEGMGIKLDKIAALPSPEDKEDMVIVETKNLKVSKETKTQIKKEIAIKDGEKPELDPTKISSEEDVTKALEYIFTATKGKSLSQTVSEAIEFIKNFRINQAKQAENAEEAVKNYDSYNSGNWLDDIFKYFKPTVVFKGIGNGIITVATSEENPIHAFLILRDALKDRKTGKPAFSDVDIAYLAKSIAKWVGGALIESNQKAIDNLDPKTNATEIEACKSGIARYERAISFFTNPSSDIISRFIEADTEAAAKTVKHIVNSYYGVKTDISKYKNGMSNVKQHAGIILNYFADGGSENPNYCESNLSDLVEYTEEELAEIKKAEMEKKKAKAESEAKKN